MIQLAENGYDIVQTQRLDDEEKSSFKKNFQMVLSVDKSNR